MLFDYIITFILVISRVKEKKVKITLKYYSKLKFKVSHIFISILNHVIYGALRYCLVCI